MWWHNPDLRCRFERGADRLARLRTTRIFDNSLTYLAFLPVEDVGAPQVRVVFRNDSPLEPTVTTPSWMQINPRWHPGHLPHRYPDDSLCLWFPLDPRDQRWAWDDGLADPYVHTAAHLMRERLWLKTGRWRGPERPHGYPEDWDAPLRRIN